MRALINLLCLPFVLQVNEALGNREYLTRAACERNPNLTFCHRIKNLRLVQSVPVIKQATRDKRTNVKRGTDEELSELNKQILQEQRKESQDYALTGDDVRALQAKCVRIAPIAQKVDLNFATVDVNGIPYYPINEEGSVGVGVLSRIPFGSWGGGYSDHVGIRDYWSQYQEAGGNWYEGKYGYKNGWSVPLVQSLGVEGGQHNTASVPLDPQNVGNVMVDNGYGVGGYYGHNDHVGENWRKGEVVHNFGVGSPFVGAGVNTGQAITFPSLDTFLNAGRK